MLIKKLNHAAFRCKDAAETVKFYTEVLGLKFSHALGNDYVPSTRQYSPHIHIFFEMEDGSSIAFFECPKDPGNMKDLESPDWIQHFAFEVESPDALLEGKRRLESKGVDVLGPVDHGFLRSIDKATYGKFEKDAPKVLELWNRTHDWSLRK
jgi:glyoxylase I family protein